MVGQGRGAWGEFAVGMPVVGETGEVGGQTKSSVAV